MSSNYIAILSLLYSSFVLYLALGACHNECSSHGTCEEFDLCKCLKDAYGNDLWTGADCSLRACPKHTSWIGKLVRSNDIHSVEECSNKGICNRRTGQCECFENFEGFACERTLCPYNCNSRGICMSEYQLAQNAEREYSTPWDADMQMGCLCDIGFHGPDCSLVECPSGKDPLKGYGKETGRDCSGRGICDYKRGVCNCFSGFGGTRCDKFMTYY